MLYKFSVLQHGVSTTRFEAVFPILALETGYSEPCLHCTVCIDHEYCIKHEYVKNKKGPNSRTGHEIRASYDHICHIQGSRVLALLTSHSKWHPRYTRVSNKAFLTAPIFPAGETETRAGGQLSSRLVDNNMWLHC